MATLENIIRNYSFIKDEAFYELRQIQERLLEQQKTIRTLILIKSERDEFP